jgi:hypothetical protein
MIAFYLSLIALGAAGAVAIREFVAAQGKERGALRPVRIRQPHEMRDANRRRG